MGRSRSRSRSPRRHRDKHRNRDRQDRHRGKRSRSREKSRERIRSRSRDRHDRRGYRDRSRSPLDKRRYEPTEKPMLNPADLEGKTEEEQEMLRIMGFCNFDTSKGKKVDNNDTGAVHVILKRKYRQYMNRKGGFNRPLDFVA